MENLIIYNCVSLDMNCSSNIKSRTNRLLPVDYSPSKCCKNVILPGAILPWCNTILLRCDLLLLCYAILDAS